MLVMKSGKRYMMEGVDLPNQLVIRTIGQTEIYKYLGILKADTTKEVEMKENFLKKEYFRRNRKLLVTKLDSSNLVKGINTWAGPLVRYSGHFLK